jgi:hypothetical protein
MLISLVFTLQKNVYSVFRANPPSIGFAQLSSAASGSGERECSLVFPVTSSLLLPLPGATTGNHSSTTSTGNGPSTASTINGSPTTTTGKDSPTTTGSGSSSTFPSTICLSISDNSFHCRWWIIGQNYIACHDDHRNDSCHVLAVIQKFSMFLHTLNVKALVT